MTTSPNVMVYAAMDGWRRQMVEHGRELLSHALDLAEQVRGEIADIPDVQVMESELLGAEASHDLTVCRCSLTSRRPAPPVTKQRIGCASTNNWIWG